MNTLKILYDATYLIVRQHYPTPTGIPRVDVAYAFHLGNRPELLSAGLRYGLLRPRVLAPSRVSALAAHVLQRWERSTAPSLDPNYENVRDFLISGSTVTQPTSRYRMLLEDIKPIIERIKLFGLHDGRFDPPHGAVYLNLAQFKLDRSGYFRWLNSRPDVKAVFMLHDLLPFDYPEHFTEQTCKDFGRRFETVRRHAAAVIVTCEATRKRVAQQFEAIGASNIPIHVQHLPPERRFSDPITLDPALAAAPYVMMVGTIQPRKNHLLLLNLWRRFAQSNCEAPRLLIIGKAGWKYEPVLEMLSGAPELRGRVMHVTGLSDGAYRHFLGHARALLQPSIMEGYGIPLVEAAAAGIPVIASDLEVFREVCQGKGDFLSPFDENAWYQAIMDLGDAAALERKRKTMATFKTPTWEDYMDRVLDFLSQI